MRHRPLLMGTILVLCGLVAAGCANDDRGAGTYECDNGASIPETTNSFGIDGTVTDVFTLTFSDGLELVSEPIDSGHARIVQDTGFGLVTSELMCENC